MQGYLFAGSIRIITASILPALLLPALPSVPFLVTVRLLINPLRPRVIFDLILGHNGWYRSILPLIILLITLILLNEI